MGALAELSVLNDRYTRETESYGVADEVLEDLSKNLGIEAGDDFKKAVSLAAQGKFDEAGLEWRTGQDIIKKENSDSENTLNFLRDINKYHVSVKEENTGFLGLGTDVYTQGKHNGEVVLKNGDPYYNIKLSERDRLMGLLVAKEVVKYDKDVSEYVRTGVINKEDATRLCEILEKQDITKDPRVMKVYVELKEKAFSKKEAIKSLGTFKYMESNVNIGSPKYNKIGQYEKKMWNVGVILRDLFKENEGFGIQLQTGRVFEGSLKLLIREHSSGFREWELQIYKPDPKKHLPFRGGVFDEVNMYKYKPIRDERYAKYLLKKHFSFLYESLYKFKKNIK